MNRTPTDRPTSHPTSHPAEPPAGPPAGTAGDGAPPGQGVPPGQGAPPRPAARLPYNHHDPALACATWSRLAEPADQAASALVGALGAAGALDWLLAEALDARGEPRRAPRPPLPTGGQAAEASARWAHAAGRWAPRLEGLDIRRELDILDRLAGSLIIPGDPWWPPGLDELEHPPFCLWLRGDPALLVSAQDLQAGSGAPGGGAATAGPGCEGSRGVERSERTESTESTANGESSETRRGGGSGEGAGSGGGGRRLPAREDRMPVGPARGSSIALVGARASTRYGDEAASALASGMTTRGALVISGGAFGVDACAHRGALTAGPTLSVAAGGVDRLYPAGNAELLQAVIAEGALVAEVPPGCQPARHRFLTRNRLIAAMAGATIVVEAAWRSGALSTAHHAMEIGRPVGAVPGPITSMASVGCHRLLRKGAVCITDTDDALELVGPLGAIDADAARAEDPRLAGSGLLDGLDPASAVVLDALPARASATTESIARASGLSVREATAALGILELAGRAERGGKGWRRRSPSGAGPAPGRGA
ncbi:DNA-processing protein DprA [Actinomyces bowdenii]|uniref:DNA-protecting protein DprA n=1 Tax=Actinomyces bowdenii TaxID=131109 RepID=A0A853ENG1_9ACTO|nr:DNA-protecting protein DprA [Actinomyces bowdenii]MBF0697123.1 DNA-processing protein DprA [Actinomyces bowdenii]NYS69296.1 DNA-protecting protein DprA [Actinomyces bowdenii]